jgi:hypothetical protein
MRKIITFLFMIFLLTADQRAVEAATVQKPLVIKSDSGLINIRTFEQAAINKYKAQKNFQYGTEYQTALSLWDRFWHWFWNFFNRAISDASSNNIINKISLVALICLGVYLIIKLSGVGVLQLFTTRSKPVALPYSEAPENIHEIDFGPEIERAIKNVDYRLAVRMLYLKCLKQLSDSGLITWQIDKTNSNYIAELVNSTRKDKFALLTRQFEYIWYGEFNIDQLTFTEIHDDFKEFQRGL